MNKYEINKNTLAIVGINDFKSMVIESDNNYVIEDNSYQVMEDSCNYFGSTFKGRVEGTKKMLDISYKVPIIIEESNELIFFPLSEIDNSKLPESSKIKNIEDFENYEEKLYKELTFNKKVPVLSKPKTMDEIFKELNELVGLKNVKKALYELVDVVELKKKGADTLKLNNLNLKSIK